MEIRQLRAFLAVCDCGSVRQAASQLFVSHQALSRTVASLEEDLGTSLLERTPQGMVLTETGKHFYKLALSIVESVDDAQRQIGAMSRQRKQTLSIGVTPLLQYFISDSALEPFQQAHPECRLTLNEYSHTDCETLLGRGMLTAALVWSPVARRGLDCVANFPRQRMCIIPTGHPLARKEVIRIRDLADVHLVCSITDHDFDTLRTLCAHWNFDPCVTRVKDTFTIEYLCAEQNMVGLSLDFLTHSRPLHLPNCVIRPMDREEFPYTLSLITRAQQLSVLEQELVDYLHQTILRRHLGAVPLYA